MMDAMPRNLLVLFAAVLCMSSLACPAGSTYPGSVEGECVVTDGAVLFRSLITSTYDAPDGSSATTRSYWDVLCSIPMGTCNGTVTVRGESGGIAAGEKTNIEDAELTDTGVGTARMEWQGALLVINVAEETVYYAAFPRALIQGEGSGGCRAGVG